MDRQAIMHDLTLMLLSISSWEEGFVGFTQRQSWKGYDFDTLDLLEDEGLIGGDRRSKSVVLSDAGIQRAKELFAQYGITLDPNPREQRFFRFLLSFDFLELACTRTLLVPEHTTFEDFHTMIQACLNWMNYHLYDFKLIANGEQLCVSWPDYETGNDPRLDHLLEGKEAPRWLNSATTHLNEYFPKAKEVVYSYDYGDGWEIKISLLNRGERFASDDPICCDGSGDAPPEDVGGEGGFEHFLTVIDNPESDDRDTMRAWGEGQGFERFKKTLTNKRLSHWRDWARADTESMPRDTQIRALGRVIAEPTSQATDKDTQRQLAMFKQHLDRSGLATKTVRAHIDNVGLFLEEYLAPRGLTVVEGLDELEDYLGDWLIDSYDYSSKTLLKGSATSLNKFYSFLADNGCVSRERQRRVQRLVRKRLTDWVAKIHERDKQRFYVFMQDRLTRDGSGT